MQTTTAIRSLILLVLATLSAPAMASYPNIEGTSNGTWSGTEQCFGGPGPVFGPDP